MYDVIVVGCGPAGIQTSLYLKRFGYNVLVIGKDGGTLEKAHLIENYYGIKSISGKELVQLGIEQAKDLGIEVIKDEVINIEKYENFIVQTPNSIYESKIVVLAVGTSRNKWSKSRDLEGKGVSYCATCDGFFYRKKRVALVGSGQYMRHELSVLENICSDLTIFSNGEELDFIPNSNIKVNKSKIVKLIGEEKLEAIETEDGKVEIDGCFVALGAQSGFTLAMHMGILLDGNSIKVDDNMQTNIEGLYAVGDVIGGVLQVSKAVGDGCVCANQIMKYLKEKTVRK